MFSDLETDYINPIDFCNKMNKVRGMLVLYVLLLNSGCLVRDTRGRRTRVPCPLLPALGPMDGIPLKRTSARLQHQQVRLSTSAYSAPY